MSNGSDRSHGALAWFVAVVLLGLVGYQVYSGLVLKKLGIPGLFEVEFADPTPVPLPVTKAEPSKPKEPLPISLVLQGTSQVLEKKREATACSAPQTSRDCHNKRDGEGGCPSFHTFNVAASTQAGKLRNPRVDCVRDNRGSCEWNAGSGHFSNATWDSVDDGRRIEYRVPVSSRSIVIRACATEDVYERVPKSVELERWSEFKNGQTFTARVPEGMVGAFTVKWPNGEQSMSPGDSARSLLFLSEAAAPGAHADYSYKVQQ